MSMGIMTRTPNLRDILDNRQFFPGRRQCIFLWNVLISLRRSWCYSIWRSELSRSLCLHNYFISNWNIFLQSDIISSRWHPWWKLDVLTFQWQVNCWRADRRHQRHVSRLRYPFPSPDYLSARFAHLFFFLPTPIFCPFSDNAEPGPRL